MHYDDYILNKKVDILKRKIISIYIYIMFSVLFFYCLFFYFVAANPVMSSYLLLVFCLFAYTWLLIRQNYSINKIVHGYIILASMSNLLVMAVFWKYSVASYMWLLPIPIAGFIFFKQKTTIIYTGYIFINIGAGYMLSRYLSLDIPTFQNREQQTVADTFIFIFNVIVVILFLYYYDKIRRVEIEFSYHQKKEKPVISNEIKKIDREEYLKFDVLFNKIQKVMLESECFKESDFTVSKLSVMLNSNSVYILKAIKQNGFANFVTFLNKYRVDFFKSLVAENDLRKVTLMYLYTESGFSNQSTFNRVFKQLEGITPSEYISQQGTGIFLTEE